MLASLCYNSKNMFKGDDPLNFLQSILYGIVSGLAEFLPISAGGHQAILMKLFGINNPDPVCTFFIHLGCLIAVFLCCKPALIRLSREFRLSVRPSKGRRNRDVRTAYDLRLLRTALIPMLIGLLIYGLTMNLAGNLLILSIFMIVNGIIIMVPEYMTQGNKTAKHMTALDGAGIGISAALSAIPGISRIGAVNSFGLYRGADRSHILNWAFVLSLPALLLMVLFDLINILSGAFAAITFGLFISYVFAGFMAFAGAYCGILLIRFLSVRSGYIAFAYYSWGAAFLALILYLTV